MTKKNEDPLFADVKLRGKSSVAHEIIDTFLLSLAHAEGYASISKNLREAIFDKKPTEASLRSALFGDDGL